MFSAGSGLQLNLAFASDCSALHTTFYVIVLGSNLCTNFSIGTGLGRCTATDAMVIDFALCLGCGSDSANGMSM